MNRSDITSADELRGQLVVDADGQQIGTILGVYLDNDTRQPEWVAVRLPSTAISSVAEDLKPVVQQRVEGVKAVATQAADQLRQEAQASAQDVKGAATASAATVKGTARSSGATVKATAAQSASTVKRTARAAAAGARPALAQ